MGASGRGEVVAGSDAAIVAVMYTNTPIHSWPTVGSTFYDVFTVVQKENSTFVRQNSASQQKSEKKACNKQ